MLRVIRRWTYLVVWQLVKIFLLHLEKSPLPDVTASLYTHTTFSMWCIQYDGNWQGSKRVADSSLKSSPLLKFWVLLWRWKCFHKSVYHSWLIRGVTHGVLWKIEVTALCLLNKYFLDGISSLKYFHRWFWCTTRTYNADL